MFEKNERAGRVLHCLNQFIPKTLTIAADLAHILNQPSGRLVETTKTKSSFAATDQI